MTSELPVTDPQQQQQQQQVEEPLQQQQQLPQVEQEAQQEQQKQKKDVQVAVLQRRGVLGFMLRGLVWPFGVVVRAYRGFWWVLGFRPPQENVQLSPPSSSPERHNVSGRKRLRGLTRLLLCVLPRWLQRALGFRSYSSIGRCVSPEIRESPTKPSGKGSKRKQDQLDEEDYVEDDEDGSEEEECHPTWVEALNVQYNEDDDEEADPDYEEPSTVSIDSEEFCSNNGTESEIELQE